MKIALFAIALSLLTVSITYAQTENQNSPAQNQEAQWRGTPEERATRQTKMMVHSLGLSADQETKVHALNLKRLNELNALHANQTANATSGRNKLGKEAKTIRHNWDTELKTILTPEQYAMFEAQRGEMQPKRSKQTSSDKKLLPAG